MLERRRFTAILCSLALMFSMSAAAVNAEKEETAAAETAAEATTAPDATDAPDAGATEAPEETGTPEATPGATANPEATEEPGATAAPNTDAPDTEATEAPEATERPKSDEPTIISDISVKDDTAEITFSYEGFNGPTSVEINAFIDPEVFDTADILKEEGRGYANIKLGDSFSSAIVNYVDSNFILAWAAADSAESDAVMAVVTLPVKNDGAAIIKFTKAVIGDEQSDGTVKKHGSQASLDYVEGTIGDVSKLATPTPNTEGGSSAESTPEPTDTPVPTAVPRKNGGNDSSDGTASNKTGTLATGVTPVNTTKNSAPVTFSDLDEAAWAETAIADLVARGAVNGYEDGTFKPNQNVTRAEFTKMLLGAFNVNVPEDAVAETVYSDVNEDDWFYRFVYYGNKLGIVNGYEDGSFKPNNPVTRQEMAVIVYRMAATTKTELTAVNEAKIFDDADQIGSWAQEAVSALQQAGVVNGMTETTFAPAETATRAQVAQIIYNLNSLRK